MYLSLAKNGKLCTGKCDSVSRRCPTLGDDYEYCTPGDLPMDLPVTRGGKKCSSLCGKYVPMDMGSDYCTVASTGELSSCVGGNSIEYLNGLDVHTTTQLTGACQLRPNILRIISQQAKPKTKKRIRRQGKGYELFCAFKPWLKDFFIDHGPDILERLYETYTTSVQAGQDGSSSDTTCVRSIDESDRIRIHKIIKKNNKRYLGTQATVFDPRLAAMRMRELDARNDDVSGPLLAFSLGM